jgi:signal transduction histidine kinase
MTEHRMAGLAHDARNLLSAVRIYCELLASPGVLTTPFRHYAGDLRRIAETGTRLGERLIEAVAVAARPMPDPQPPAAFGAVFSPLAHPFPGICDLAAEVLQMERLLAGLAGPQVHFEMECLPCAGELGLNSEELLRILFNLVANAVEAFDLDAETQVQDVPGPTRFLRITVQRGGAASFLPRSRNLCHGPRTVVLSVRDSGPGMSADQAKRIFDAGFSTRLEAGDGPDRPRGLGLSIVRELVEQAGGAIRAVSARGFGTRFDIELPILNRRFKAIAPQKTDLTTDSMTDPKTDSPRAGQPSSGTLAWNRNAVSAARRYSRRKTTGPNSFRRGHSQFLKLLNPKK